MYCSRAYNFYSRMTHASGKGSLKAFTKAKAREKEKLEKESMINELENQIFELENRIEQFQDISLINVEVEHSKYGKGVIITQDKNEVVIKFADFEKRFVIRKKY